MIKKISSVRTSTLEIAYEDCGPDANPVVLLHGWPDDVRTWDSVVEELVKAGCEDSSLSASVTAQTIAILKRACVPGRDHPPSPALSL